MWSCEEGTKGSFLRCYMRIIIEVERRSMCLKVNCGVVCKRSSHMTMAGHLGMASLFSAGVAQNIYLSRGRTFLRVR